MAKKLRPSESEGLLVTASQPTSTPVPTQSQSDMLTFYNMFMQQIMTTMAGGDANTLNVLQSSLAPMNAETMEYFQYVMHYLTSTGADPTTLMNQFSMFSQASGAEAVSTTYLPPPSGPIAPTTVEGIGSGANPVGVPETSTEAASMAVNGVSNHVNEVVSHNATTGVAAVPNAFLLNMMMQFAGGGAGSSVNPMMDPNMMTYMMQMFMQPQLPHPTAPVEYAEVNPPSTSVPTHPEVRQDAYNAVGGEVGSSEVFHALIGGTASNENIV